ncbi:MAG: hypothetical protein CVU97_06230 [Firmicutes bacterium HGW-Firmicutes-21]|nr:MAG: hypothetical protein CVU97_06230 [Firmicutes bacterium HGW-Firmicutes-21]
MDNYLGLMIASLAGRDKGRYAAVVAIVDENFVMIADGRTRRTEAPKKKKLKHIRIIAGVDETLMRLEPDKLTNRFIRERINEIESSLGNTV